MDIALGTYLHCTSTSGACLQLCAKSALIQCGKLSNLLLCWALAMFTDGPKCTVGNKPLSVLTNVNKSQQRKQKLLPTRAAGPCCHDCVTQPEWARNVMADHREECAADGGNATIKALLAVWGVAWVL